MSWHLAPLLKTGRSALRLILELSQATCVYLPYYSCHTLATPMLQAGIPIRFYGLNSRQEPASLPALHPGEFLLYINYNDAQRDTATRLYGQFGTQLILDNTQAFFWRPGFQCWSFNSCRKFFGVPDGAYLFAPASARLPDISTWPENTLFITDHLRLRNEGRVEEGYPFYRQHEALLDNAPEQACSLTRTCLERLDYEGIAARRRANYQKLHDILGAGNRWQKTLEPGCVPLYYPFLPIVPLQWERLWQLQVFAPHFWPDWIGLASDPAFAADIAFARYLLPLPLDQRYTESDMELMAERILSLLK